MVAKMTYLFLKNTVEFRRLDHLAQDYLGDASLWWVIAAASGIGWGLQIPEGTRLVVPINKEQLGGLI